MESSNPAFAPKPASMSYSTMTEYVLPVHANALGTVFGGQILAWMDICASICASRHAGAIAVTAGLDEVSFEQAIKVGEIVRIEARITATFRTSMEIQVVVHGENPRTRTEWRCITAFLSFVTIDDEGRPQAVPPLVIENDEQRRIQEAAYARRAHRLGRK